MAATNVSASTVPDGRRVRRDENREAVVDAVLALWADGDLAPDVAAIAARSGVSERSIFRYFDDVAALQRAVITRQVQREAGLFDPPSTDGSLQARVSRYVELRLRQYEVLGPVARVAFLRAPFEEAVREQINLRRDQIRAQITHLFAPELARFDGRARTEVVAAIEVATSFEALEHLRTSRDLSASRASRVLVLATESLLRSLPIGGQQP